MRAFRSSLLLIAFLFSAFVSTGRCYCQVDLNEMLAASELERDQCEPIAKSLDEICSLELFEQPLTDLRDFVRRRFGIPVAFDIAGLDLAGLSPEDQLTVSAKSISLRSALNRALDPLDATIAIRNGTLMITSNEAAAETLSQRIYDISHLVDCEIDFVEVGRVRYGGGNERRIGRITTVIRKSISSRSWTEVGGFGSIEHIELKDEKVVLSVSQTEDAHWQIKCYLGELTSLTKRHGSSSNSGSGSQGRKIISDHEIVTFVYPIKPELMTPEESIEMIESALGEQILGREKKAFFVKSFGNTLVIRNTKKSHDDIYQLLNDADVLKEEATGGRGGGNLHSGGLSCGGFSGGAFSGAAFSAGGACF